MIFKKRYLIAIFMFQFIDTIPTNGAVSRVIVTNKTNDQLSVIGQVARPGCDCGLWSLPMYIESGETGSLDNGNYYGQIIQIKVQTKRGKLADPKTVDRPQGNTWWWNVEVTRDARGYVLKATK